LPRETEINKKKPETPKNANWKTLQPMSASNGSVTLYDEMARCGREHVVFDSGSTPCGETDTRDRPLHFL